MPKRVEFPFSDLIAGYVVNFDSSTDKFTLKTSDGREFEVGLTPTTYAEIIRNLGEGYQDAGDMRAMMVPGRFVFAYGIFYPDGPDGEYLFDAKHIVFAGRAENQYVFEKPDWWVKQIEQLGDFYIESQFDYSKDHDIDYSEYRTNLNISGIKKTAGRQETDTISRLVYGFATAYMMTGKEIFLEAATKGTDYLRDHLRFQDKSEGICYWYHAVDIKEDGTEQKLFTSEFGDDYDAIPCYEQIYALAGPTQTFRITGDPRILEDIKGTINLFNRFFKDQTDKGGYYSHIDPITLSAHTEGLGRNKAKKNWNSVGDHAPAYLINLYLATGAPEYADMLEYTFDTITAHFPDYDNSPFVQEKFFDDWSKDQTWGWQQNRAVVGHNLKIAWNLTRMYGLKPKQEYKDFAHKIGDVIPDAGCDRQRGGWWDVVERVVPEGQKYHRFAWHDRKAWWQQEQGILAYYIMEGVYGDKPEYLNYAREGTAFYNAWFLDTEEGGVYFNVLTNGIPYAMGTERGKGSHSMSGYHSFELCYLAAVYTNLLVMKEPMDFYFKPIPGGFPDNILRVAPDILPPGSVRIIEVWLNGESYTNYNADALTVTLPADRSEELKIRVRIVPSSVHFSADLVEVTGGVAKIALEGNLDSKGLKYLQDVMASVKEQKATAIEFDMIQLEAISSEAVRYLIFTKQKLGSSFNITIIGASGQVKEAIQNSEFNYAVTMK
ncbi:MAG TPA: N-acyl-D-glucosamine 2-epimerase [Oscillatoriaceae cyanobacterium M33_DOE_052]|uniref:N-acyl-D-glucosamine 2-epimerase n=1 Tax=Planktothricoides sp. SpSt-374 TaxID=2282167 RepID=A0A7C3ZWA5_9CYAN|nr:N-acyl-D-glucosamine 2-epimerase [Oscillatoriaceae cyanobacterium M33_DOE_052]